MKNPAVSIIIRTKNEERWISSCLEGIYSQEYHNFEIIIVDNYSGDKTLEKIKNYNISRVVKIKNYLPGKALNAGIKYAIGKYVVCISAHCIPKNTKWLGNLVNGIEEDKLYAGVYGRQEPMAFSSPSDKRDMLLIFGLDRKVQMKDSFFHNANSIIRRDLWEDVQFDNSITNIEDRIWAQEMLNTGYKLLYEPEASVYHYHGINQDGNQERLTNVVRIIDERSNSLNPGQLDADKMKIVAIIPTKGKQRYIDNQPQLFYTIKTAQYSDYLDDIFIATDNKNTANIAQGLGAKCPFIRPSHLSEPFINLEVVQKYSLNKIEAAGIYPDLIVHMEETFPFRPKNMIDDMINQLLSGGYDSVISAKPESGYLWQENIKGTYSRIDSGDIPREFKENSYIGLHGLCTITYPEFIREGRILGDKIGLFKVDHPFASVEVREKQTAELASRIIKNEIFQI